MVKRWANGPLLVTKYHHHHPHHQLRLQVQLVQVKTEKTQQDCGAVTILIAGATCNYLTSFSQKIVTIDPKSTYDKLNLLEANVTMLMTGQRYCSGAITAPSATTCLLVFPATYFGIPVIIIIFVIIVRC